MTKILIAIYGFLASSVSRFFYGPWSRFLRWLLEQKYTQLPLLLPWKTTDLLDFFKQCEWVPDRWWQLLDQISKPEKFYETQRGDCDEYAVFAGAVMSDKNCILLSVQWYNPKGEGFFKKFSGHNVCVWREANGYWHIGNWGIMGPFATQEKLIASIVQDNVYASHAFRNIRSLKWIGKKIPF